MRENTENQNNVVTVGGVIFSEPAFSHEIMGEGFYVFELEVLRKSDTADYVPVMVSDRAVDLEALKEGTPILVSGSFRSYNKHLENKNKLILYVFADELEFTEEPTNENEICLEGYICKSPKYRKTPLGREIADMLIAVNRAYGKSDYLPCITWGRNATYTEKLEVGTMVSCRGRIQSRRYLKEEQEKIAYEVSVSSIQTEQ